MVVFLSLFLAAPLAAETSSGLTLVTAGRLLDPKTGNILSPAGVLIENGKITTPVMNFRFNESPVRLLKNAKRLGIATRVRGLEGGMMIAPAILAGDFPLTSISDAI